MNSLFNDTGRVANSLIGPCFLATSRRQSAYVISHQWLNRLEIEIADKHECEI